MLLFQLPIGPESPITPDNIPKNIIISIKNNNPKIRRYINVQKDCSLYFIIEKIILKTNCINDKQIIIFENIIYSTLSFLNPKYKNESAPKTPFSRKTLKIG